MLSEREKLEAIGATVLFVVHDRADLIRAGLLEGLDVPFPVLVDEARQAYEAWGLRRASVAGVWLDPRVWARYLALIARGERVRRVGADTLQLGGDFIVDRDGIIVYSRAQSRDDRPPVSRLVAVAEALG